ncbi:MAG: tRNA (adenosine(37)-N6)-dimethylallyltransferase MiaA [Dysgonamonadaceae bacterium]|nr:tRNA (adenosine(37)-N6)-dimethylallyltransferase MiaA [Dysgonamonadaceae bacterium]
MTELITILGPTASGKTALAAKLAYALDTEIISGDSRQVYRNMTLGTGKDLNDYIVNGRQIVCHLIDICDPGQKYNIFEYQSDFHNVFSALKEKGKVPVLCGGSGLYIESVLKGYELPDVPENHALRDSLKSRSLDELSVILQSYKKLHNTTDLDSARRAVRAIEIEEYRLKSAVNQHRYPPIDSLIIGIDLSRELRRDRITRRLKTRLDEGMLDEVRQLLQSGLSEEDLIYYGLEYKYLTRCLIGELTYDEMFRQLEIAIHQFAKRQMTWFRGMERRGFHIHWIDAMLDDDEKIAMIQRLLTC